MPSTRHNPAEDMSFQQRVHSSQAAQKSNTNDPDGSTQALQATGFSPDSTVIQRTHYEQVVVRENGHAHLGDVIMEQNHTYNVVQHVTCTKKHDGNCATDFNGTQQAIGFHEGWEHPSTVEDDTTSAPKFDYEQLLYRVKDVVYSAKDVLYTSKDVLHTSKDIVRVSEDMKRNTGEALDCARTTLCVAETILDHNRIILDNHETFRRVAVDAIGSAQNFVTSTENLVLAQQRVLKGQQELREKEQDVRDAEDRLRALRSMTSHTPWRHIWDYQLLRYEVLYLTRIVRAGLRRLFPRWVAPEISYSTTLDYYVSHKSTGSDQKITRTEWIQKSVYTLHMKRELNITECIGAVVSLVQHIFVLLTAGAALLAVLEDFTLLIPRTDALLNATYFGTGLAIPHLLYSIFQIVRSRSRAETETQTEDETEVDTEPKTWIQRVFSLNKIATWITIYLFLTICNVVWIQEELFVISVRYEPIRQSCRRRYYDHGWVSFFSDLFPFFASMIEAKTKCEGHNFSLRSAPYCPPHVRRVDIWDEDKWLGIWCNARMGGIDQRMHLDFEMSE